MKQAKMTLSRLKQQQEAQQQAAAQQQVTPTDACPADLTLHDVCGTAWGADKLALP